MNIILFKLCFENYIYLWPRKASGKKKKQKRKNPRQNLPKANKPKVEPGHYIDTNV